MIRSSCSSRERSSSAGLPVIPGKRLLMPASHRRVSSTRASPAIPITEASGTTGCFHPMSVTGSIRQRSASASVCAIRLLRSAAPYPAACMISLPSWSICAADLSQPCPLGCSSGAAEVRAAISGCGRNPAHPRWPPRPRRHTARRCSARRDPCSAASLSIRTAWAVLSGSPGGLSWLTTSAATVPGGMASSQRLNRVRGRSVAPPSHGTSDVGVGSDQHGQHRLEGFRVQGAGSQLGPGHGDGHRSPGLARGAGMRIGDQPAQRTVAGAVVVPVGQHDDASPTWVRRSPSSSKTARSTPTTGSSPAAMQAFRCLTVP